MRSKPFLHAEQAPLVWDVPGLMAGVDEAGRGPLAGPVVAAACVLGPDAPAGLDDSKKLSAKRRAALEPLIKASCHWALGVVDAEEIDRINIFAATMLAMTRAVEALGLEPGEVLVEAAAGENWHAFTQRTLVMGLGGLENLSLIPGTVGAAPVQNIGAYGVELADVMHALTAYDRVTRQYVDIAAADCAFGYRESRFKSAEPGRHVIVRVRFRLSRQPALRIGYGDIRQALALLLRRAGRG